VTHAADEHVPGRAYERNRLPPLACSTLQQPLQAVGGQRPPAGDRELSLGRHAAPPRWRRTGGERRRVEPSATVPTFGPTLPAALAFSAPTARAVLTRKCRFCR